MPSMPPEAVAMMLELYAKAIRQRKLSTEEASAMLDREAQLVRQTAREEAEDRQTWGAYRTP